ncbi:MAG: DUF3298 and DUF4163 domain-containing protein [Acidobacteriota bacterium]|nr:DUF3298 and DUF4163 domain-containing protein [Acidobacteriota bacterium]MDQ5835771.1 DUF3298 and DUF4163 domain-containing protein [Acidobacteriota bacterium]
MRLRIPRTFFALLPAVVLFLPAQALDGAASPFGRAPLAPAQAQSPARSQSGEWKSFRGTVGKYRVQMRLRRAGDALDGSYFYERSQRGGLRLEGAVDGEGHFTLREFDAAGAQTGLFKGTWDEEEQEQELYLTGQWSRPDGTRQTEFSLAEMFIAFRGPARIVTRELKDADRRMNFEINIEYPQLEGLSAAGAAGFNEAARALAAKEAANFRKGVAEYRADYRGEKPSGPGNSLDLGYYVDYADDNLVSIGFTEDTYYAGAAHPNHATVVLNYDLKAGRALRLADLFRPGSPYLKTISDYCLRELKGDSDLEGTTDMIDAGASARLENYRNWLVKRQGLEITFDPYQVGPYVAGPQYVTIPYKALAKIINPSGPLAPLLK